MPWTAPQSARQNPPYVAGERQMLEAWLDFHRQTLLGKCSGLTADQLRHRHWVALRELYRAHLQAR